jgi:hypothetical protein
MAIITINCQGLSSTLTPLAASATPRAQYKNSEIIFQSLRNAFWQYLIYSVFHSQTPQWQLRIVAGYQIP